MKIKKCDALSYMLELAQEASENLKGAEWDQYYDMREVAESLLDEICDCTEEELINSPQSLENYLKLKE